MNGRRFATVQSLNARLNAQAMPKDPSDSSAATPEVPAKAAALTYDREKDAAPRLSAKGRGQVAEKIIEIAKAHNIPIQRDADLVEILEKVELDSEVPLEVYAVVAEIFAYLYKVNKQKAGA
jgi:flagellar biosynthesis protein